MSLNNQYHTLFNYHFHTTFRLLESAAKLDEVAYKEHPGYGHGSIHDLFFHILRTDWAWRLGLETGQQPALLRLKEHLDLDTVKAGFEKEQSSYNTYLDSLSEEDIEGTVNLTTWRGDTYPMVRWNVLQHLAFHGMQHHTEIAQLLTAKDQSPGDIDFIFYV